jgi:hypothetical protein
MMRTLILAVALMLTACTNQPWNQFNRGVETMAHGVAETDEWAADVLRDEDVIPARQAILEIVRADVDAYNACVTDCVEPPSVDEYMERYQNLRNTSEIVARCIEVLRETLELAQGVAEQWREFRERPDDISGLCSRIQRDYRALLAVVESIGIAQINDSRALRYLEQAQDYIQPACVFIAQGVAQ